MGKRVGTAHWVESQKRWRIDVQKDGKQRSFYSSKPGRNGQREANSKADLWLDDGVDGSTKVSVMSARYLQSLADRKTSKGHQVQCEQYMRLYIIPKIGNKRIGDISEEHLQDIINFAHSIGNGGQGLANKTLHNIRLCIKNFIKFCRISKTTTLFPESLMIPRDARKSTRGALQPNDIKKLFESDETLFNGKRAKDWYIHAYRLEVIIGFRPGELVGLNISDIVGKQCRINRAFNIYGEETKGKNENAQRVFEIPEIGLREIREQRKMLLAAGIQTDILFPAPNGNRLRQATYARHWKIYRDYNDISQTTPYELRHTFFSVNKDMPGELIKPIGGHSESFDGFSVYSHEQEGDAHRAAVLIDKAFERILK